MREIKFRAWDLISGTMRHVSVIEFDAAGEICNVALPGPALNTKNGQYARFEERENGDDLILRQYTGLKDKNGKEIYVGDIFECMYARDGHTDHHYVVEYSSDETGFVLIRTGEPCAQTQVHQKVRDHAGWCGKIIGNVYENPELLTV